MTVDTTGEGEEGAEALLFPSYSPYLTGGLLLYTLATLGGVLGSAGDCTWEDVRYVFPEFRHMEHASFIREIQVSV